MRRMLTVALGTIAAVLLLVVDTSTSASPAWVAQHQSASGGAAPATAASSRCAWAQHS